MHNSSPAEAIDRSRTLMICHRVSKQTLDITVGLSALVLLASSWVAWDGTVPAWEVDATKFFNDWPDWLEPIFWALQQVGVTGAPIVAGLTIVFFTRRWQHIVPFLLVLPMKLGIEKGVVKQLVERERPFTSIGPEITVRGGTFEGLSFPSGHTTTAFAVAVLVAAFLPPRWRLLPIVWAFVVAIARLYEGAHNLLDVVAGAALGIAFATILWFAILNRFVHPDCDC
jgi:membrane-associated phospholipid phosphatase